MGLKTGWTLKNTGVWRNWFICLFVGCRLDWVWDAYQIGPTCSDKDVFIIKQCSRCGVAEHHGMVRKGIIKWALT